MFLNLIFTLFVLMIIRQICKLRKARKVARMTIFGDPIEIKKCINRLKDRKMEGGKPIKHFNGRFYW